MKRYFPFFFLCLAWAVMAAFADVRLLPAAAGAAAAWICFLFIRKPSAGAIFSAVLLVGVGIYKPDFAFRCAPALLLCFARRAAAYAAAEKKKNNARNDGVYTLILAAGLFAAGVLIRDVMFFTRNRVHEGFRPVFSIAFFAAFGCAAVGVFALRRKSVGRLYAAVCVSAGVCAVFAAVGFFMNTFFYDVCTAAFPWLLWLASVSPDAPENASVSAGFLRITWDRTSAVG